MNEDLIIGFILGLAAYNHYQLVVTRFNKAKNKRKRYTSRQNRQRPKPVFK